MLTGATILILFAVDAGAIYAFVSAGMGAWSVVLMGLCFHILSAAMLVRLLVWFFPVANGEFAEGSREFDRWQARAFLLCLSCNYFDQFLPIFVRAQWYILFGAKVAWSAKIAGRILDCPMVEVEPGALLGIESLVTAHYQLGDRVRVGCVHVRRGATVGMRATVFPGVEVEESACVAAGALVAAGRKIPAGETWGGVPAKPLAIPRKGTLSAATVSAEEVARVDIGEAELG